MRGFTISRIRSRRVCAPPGASFIPLLPRSWHCASPLRQAHGGHMRGAVATLEKSTPMRAPKGSSIFNGGRIRSAPRRTQLHASRAVSRLPRHHRLARLIGRCWRSGRARRQHRLRHRRLPPARRGPGSGLRSMGVGAGCAGPRRRQFRRFRRGSRRGLHRGFSGAAHPDDRFRQGQLLRAGGRLAVLTLDYPAPRPAATWVFT